ncbi:MAG TPA: energy transducer TonB [Syntrophorhabdaceae bacterium]|nr:energy transducer TonB [Syntrophorhabdaceae bacterium]
MNKKIGSIRKEFVLSLLVHFVVLSAAIVLAGQFDKKLDAPVVVFLSDEMPGGNGGSGIKDVGFQIKKGQPSPVAHRIMAAKAAQVLTEQAVSIDRNKADNAQPKTAPLDAPSVENVVTATTVPAGSPTGTGSIGGGSGGPGGGGFGVGSGGEGGSGGGTGRGHGTGSGDANLLIEQYLAEHYAYIRDLIMKHLTYPQIAKRMGWKGKVVVSFLIKENGSVENSRIIVSSGHEVLDKNVLAVIKEVQPFPRPPMKAELIMPVTYKLE